MSGIDGVFADLPTTYPELQRYLTSAHEAFRMRIAQALEPSLNAFVQAAILKTSDDYRRLALLIDQTLTNLGLCLTFKSEPALLIAEGGHLEDRAPHFAILTRREGAPKYAVTRLSLPLPHLSIMAAPSDAELLLNPMRVKAYPSRSCYHRVMSYPVCK